MMVGKGVELLKAEMSLLSKRLRNTACGVNGLDGLDGLIQCWTVVCFNLCHFPSLIK